MKRPGPGARCRVNPKLHTCAPNHHPHPNPPCQLLPRLPALPTLAAAAPLLPLSDRTVRTHVPSSCLRGGFNPLLLCRLVDPGMKSNRRGRRCLPCDRFHRACIGYLSLPAIHHDHVPCTEPEVHSRGCALTGRTGSALRQSFPTAPSRPKLRSSARLPSDSPLRAVPLSSVQCRPERRRAPVR